MQREIEEGEKFSDAMRKRKLFPSTALWFASVGEERGNLEEGLEQIADFYTVVIESTTQKINDLSNPFAALTFGIFVGFITTGLFSALVAMAEALM